MLKKIITLEWYSLLLCIFSTPLFESPKSIFLVITAVLFSICHFIEKDWKEILFIKDPRLGFLALALAAFISAIFAQKPGLAIHGSFDFLKMYFLFVIVATDFLDKKSIKTIALVVIVSTTIGTVWGLSEYSIGKSQAFQLNSVGHVNTSATYLALTLTLTVPFLKLLKDNIKKVFILLSASTMLTALIIAGSRAAILAIIVASIVMLIFMKWKKQRTYIFIGATVMGIIILLLISDLSLLKKDTSLSDVSLLARIKHWENAWEIFKTHLLFGIGAKHYKFYNPFTGIGKDAHSLYFEIIAQLGIVGFAALVLFFYLVAKSIKQSYKKSILWSVALGAFVVILVNGIFNPTLHSEQGLLFALILALGLNNNYREPSLNKQDYYML
ncbi:MAG: hypothetical protein CVV37_08165 [Nitrospira bacterium HGW-Nitrospira-1]|nr:MAG: hypothetical protein CVV37_08165 [Nitrospira bacterium HGW-Nitrospira-1]